MIPNPQDFVFFSDFQYPPKITSGSTVVGATDYGLKVLTTGVTLDMDYQVYEQRVLGSTNETIIQKLTTAYVDPSGNLVAQPSFPPSTLIWRTYGY